MHRDVLQSLVEALDGGVGCVYCCVVETRGSTPQKPGAAMLVFPDGSQVGTLGGGCVEAEVKRRALRYLGQDDAQALTFFLDDNYGWDDGLICGGRMTILVQPLRPETPYFPEACAYFRRLLRRSRTGEGYTEAVAYAAAECPVGARVLYDRGQQVLATLQVADSVHGWPAPLPEKTRAYYQNGIAYLPALPRVILLIVGAGHVGQAVAHLAAQADFDIWVVDDRASYANKDRFPVAKELRVGDIGATLRDMRETGQIGRRVFAVIVTRGHAHDEEALYHLAQSEAGYVGLIGSKRKIRLIFNDLVARGVSAQALARVHAPVGLDIGSQSVTEIAVSIVAELIAVRNLGHSPRGPQPGAVFLGLPEDSVPVCSPEADNA
ncbi:MAG: hypothetical protein C4297_14185 [Gemmataceae bacterium]